MTFDLLLDISSGRIKANLKCACVYSTGPCCYICLETLFTSAATPNRPHDIVLYNWKVIYMKITLFLYMKDISYFLLFRTRLLIHMDCGIQISLHVLAAQPLIHRVLNGTVVVFINLTLSLQNKWIVDFHWLKIHIHCKMKKRFSYNIEWKCGQCRSEIRLHVLYSLILSIMFTKASCVVISKERVNGYGWF